MIIDEQKKVTLEDAKQAILRRIVNDTKIVEHRGPECEALAHAYQSLVMAENIEFLGNDGDGDDDLVLS